MYDEVKSEYTTLSMLELQFKIGNHFKNTDDIANKFRTMIMTKLKMAIRGGDCDYQNI